jgi:hypothetical protein
VSKHDLLSANITHRNGEMDGVRYRDPQVAAADSLHDVVLTNTLCPMVCASYLHTVPTDIGDNAQYQSGDDIPI